MKEKQVQDLFERMIAAGFTDLAHDDGRGKARTLSVEQLTALCCKEQESYVTCKTPTGRQAWFFIVTTNKPSGLVEDWWSGGGGDADTRNFLQKFADDYT